MRISVSGASGFLGSHLVDDLRVHGHEVIRLVRRAPRSADESQWDPQAGAVDPEVVSWSDVVVNLSGSGLVGNPRSARWARELRESRVSSTSTLARAIAATERPPALLSGNGSSWYGDHGDEVVTEDSDSRGTALLTRVTREWQAATQPAVDAGARVCVLRTAPVLDRSTPPMQWLRLLFLAGLGGRLGDGRQWMPMISLRDWVGAVRFLAEQPGLAGPVNLCCEETPTNADFTRALGRALHRPAVLPVPAAAVRLAAGPFAPEVLSSVRTRPGVLERAGYEFQDPEVDAVVATALT